jgi:hypothetical protein
MYGILRLISLVLMFASVRYIVNNVAWISLLFAVLFSHYLFAFIAAKRQFAAHLRHAKGRWLMAIFSGLSIFVANRFPDTMVYYFTVHFAFSEAYAYPRARELGAQAPWTDAGRVTQGLQALLMILAFCLTFKVPLPLPLHIVVATTGATAALYGAAVWLTRQQNTRARIFSVTVPDFLWVLAGLASAGGLISWRWQAGVFYHIILWTFLPFLRRDGIVMAQAGRYFAATTVTTLVLYCLSPYVLQRVIDAQTGAAAMLVWNRQSQIWGFLHFFLTFLISTANPRWWRVLID